MSFLARSVRRSVRHSVAQHVHPSHRIHYRASLASFGDHLDGYKSQNRCFSSAQDRLGRTLYRQLLRWCQDTGDDIPLAKYVPPVTTMPPIVDEAALKRLADGQEGFIRQLLPSNTILEEHQMTVPLRKASDIRNFFRAVYRMNMVSTDQETQKKRVSMAFETLKSVNELTGALKDVQAQRGKHLDRAGVDFSVGQVVQHKKDRWRGIVLGWERIAPLPEGQLTSLTTKAYASHDGDTPEEPPGDRIRCTMIVDSGDAHLCGERRQVQSQSGYPVAFQSELELVQDLSLCRIRSHSVDQHFDRFDATSKSFVPNEARQYEYPLDESHLKTTDKEEEAAKARNEIGGSIAQAIQNFAARLESRILDEMPNAESRGLHIIADFQHRLSRLASGDVLTEEDQLTKLCTSSFVATLHLQRLLNLSLEIAELLWQRRIAKEAIDDIHFRLGDIVEHTKYGFRGVVVAWDPKPAVDVSMWDGLGDIDDPNEKPFYHIIPDQSDCIKIFGGERPFRYVCEENLELCPRHRTLIDVDLDLDWEKDDQEARYISPQDLKFKYGEDIDDDNVTEQCCTHIYNDISVLHLAQRGITDVGDKEIQQVGNSLSTDLLFKFLKLANNRNSAVAVEETMKELWKAHPDPALRSRLDSGITDLLRGKREKALITFKELINDDPDYGEAWNKASTCYFMLGDMQASLEAANKALELIPHHFQVLNGLGLIQYETRRYKLAAMSFRQSLQMDPWSPVSSRLAACLDLLYGSDLKEEQGAAEGTAPYE